MSDDLKKFFSPEARDARRAERLSKFESLKGNVGHGRQAAAEKITTQNAGLKAVAMVREVLNNYHLPGLPKLSYSGIRNARTAMNSKKIQDGVVTVTASFKSTSGVGISFDVPVEIHEGQLLEPSVIVHNGEPRVIAQSAFDGIVERNTIKEYVPVRDLYAAPMDKEIASELYENRMKRTKVNRGMFSVEANRENLRRAVRGQDPLPVESEADTSTHEAASKPVKQPKPPKAPKVPGALKPPAPPKLKSKPSKMLCSKCNHAPCVCPNKRKKKALEIVEAELQRLQSLDKTAQTADTGQLIKQLEQIVKQFKQQEKPQGLVGPDGKPVSSPKKNQPADAGEAKVSPQAPPKADPAAPAAPAAPPSSNAAPPAAPKADPAAPAAPADPASPAAPAEGEDGGFATPQQANPQMGSVMKAVESHPYYKGKYGQFFSALNEASSKPVDQQYAFVPKIQSVLQEMAQDPKSARLYKQVKGPLEKYINGLRPKKNLMTKVKDMFQPREPEVWEQSTHSWDPEKGYRQNKPNQFKQSSIYRPIVRKVASDLIAKVNEEVNRMKSDGLPDIDIRQAVFTKYGPQVASAVFDGE